MDLHGKTALVTGSNTGIGRVTAEALTRQGARVVLANRSIEKTQPVVDAIRAAGGQADTLTLALAYLARVRVSAAAFLVMDMLVHLPVNHYGLVGISGTTKDGFELILGTNHLGTYLFTRPFMPAVDQAAREPGEA